MDEHKPPARLERAARSAWREAADAFRLSGATRDLQEIEAQLGSLST